MKTAAYAWLIGGALWLAAGVADNGSHEALWLVSDGLIAIGLVGLWRADLHGGSGLGAAGMAVAAVGRVAFIVAEIISAVSGNDDNAVLPIAALLTVIGMTLYGAAVLRAQRVASWTRLVPLTVGVYPLVAMFPIVAATGNPSEFAIALWGIPIALVGLTLARQPAAAFASVAAVGQD